MIRAARERAARERSERVKAAQTALAEIKRHAKCETVRTLPSFRDAYAPRRCILPGGWLLRVEGDQRPEGETALCNCHEGWLAIWHCRPTGADRLPSRPQLRSHPSHQPPCECHQGYNPPEQDAHVPICGQWI